MVSTNAEAKSGGVAVKILRKLTSISVSPSQLMQLTEMIGTELKEIRDRQAAEYLDETLEPDVPKPPRVAAIASVLEELRRWQTSHPSPPGETLAKTDGRSIVARAVTYLSNNESRMNYPKYRRAGLPVTSAMVESLIKEFNYRVKGTEKSWNRLRGCEAILQVRNAVLCDDRDRLSEFILSRPGSAYYRPSTAKRASQASTVAA